MAPPPRDRKAEPGLIQGETQYDGDDYSHGPEAAHDAAYQALGDGDSRRIDGLVAAAPFLITNEALREEEGPEPLLNQAFAQEALAEQLHIHCSPGRALGLGDPRLRRVVVFIPIGEG